MGGGNEENNMIVEIRKTGKDNDSREKKRLGKDKEEKNMITERKREEHEQWKRKRGKHNRREGKQEKKMIVEKEHLLPTRDEEEIEKGKIIHEEKIN